LPWGKRIPIQLEKKEIQKTKTGKERGLRGKKGSAGILKYHDRREKSSGSSYKCIAKGSPGKKEMDQTGTGLEGGTRIWRVLSASEKKKKPDVEKKRKKRRGGARSPRTGKESHSTIAKS